MSVSHPVGLKCLSPIGLENQRDGRAEPTIGTSSVGRSLCYRYNTVSGVVYLQVCVEIRFPPACCGGGRKHQLIATNGQIRV